MVPAESQRATGLGDGVEEARVWGGGQREKGGGEGKEGEEWPRNRKRREGEREEREGGGSQSEKTWEGREKGDRPGREETGFPGGPRGRILPMQETPDRSLSPTPAFLPGKSHGRRSLAGYSPWGRKILTD